MLLHGFKVSPFVRHCHIVLLHSGLDFDFIITDGSEAAKLSPIAKVPFLKDGDLFLNDSASILKYVREKSGQSFLTDVRDYDLFALCNAVVDSVVNIFLFERTGLYVQDNKYLQRQQRRVQSGLVELEKRIMADYENADVDTVLKNDALLRIAVFIEWALFRERIEAGALPALLNLVTLAKMDSVYAQTSPDLIAD